MALMSPDNVIEHYKDGDEIGWPDELQWLWTEHRQQLLALMDSVLEEGFREPVILGNDGRVWDGHHRIAVALALGLRLPVDIEATYRRGPRTGKCDVSGGLQCDLPKGHSHGHYNDKAGSAF